MLLPPEYDPHELNIKKRRRTNQIVSSQGFAKGVENADSRTKVLLYGEDFV